MKRKIIYLVGTIVAVVILVAIMAARRQPASSVEDELQRVMSNYQKTFKLDTSTAIFPDGRTTSVSNKTNR